MVRVSGSGQAAREAEPVDQLGSVPSFSSLRGSWLPRTAHPRSHGGHEVRECRTASADGHDPTIPEAWVACNPVPYSASTIVGGRPSSRRANGGSSAVARRGAPLRPRAPGPGWVDAPTCQTPPTGGRDPMRGSGRQRKFWSSASEPPYGSPWTRLTLAASEIGR